MIHTIRAVRKSYSEGGLSSAFEELFLRTVHDKICYLRNKEFRKSDPQVWIHIGAHKTGSSAIQWALNSCRKELRKSSICCDGKARNLAQTLFNSNLSDSKLSDIQAKWKSRLKNRPERITILSSERFSGAPYLAYSDSTEIARKLSIIFSGVRTKIFVVVRRQDTWAESVYQQYIKVGHSSSFNEFLTGCGPFPVQWDRLLDGYAQYFGKDSVSAIPYERLFKSDNSIKQLFGDSADLISLQPKQLPTKNPGLSQTGLEILRRANELIERSQTDQLRKFLEKQFVCNANDRYSYFDDDARNKFLDASLESNRRLFEHYLPNDDLELYAPA